METIDGSTNCLQLVQHGVHMNLNSALYSLVTPPRRTMKTVPPKRRLSTPVDIQASFFANQSKVSANRESPSRLSPSQAMDGKGFYAGAKFGERPLPTELPPPPNHWVSLANQKWGSEEQSCMEMTNSLKVLLKVQS